MTSYAGWLHHIAQQPGNFPYPASAQSVAVFDTDFGSGAAFFAYQAFLNTQSSPYSGICHYVALTAALPAADTLITGTDAHTALRHEMAAQWPQAVAGYHRLILQQGRVVLTLIVGDRQQALAQLQGTFHQFLIHHVDDWTIYDDKKLGLLAKPHAGCFARHLLPAHKAWLTQAGFTIEVTNDQNRIDISGVYTRPVRHTEPAAIQSQSDKKAIVIGGGLAGTTVSERLTARDWSVTLIEAEKAVAQKASGNLAGVFMPMLSQDDNVATQLIRTAFFFAQQLWRQTGGIGQAIQGAQCGVLQIARDTAQREAFKHIDETLSYPAGYGRYVNADTAAQIAGIATGDGYYFPGGGWLHPPSVCDAMINTCHARSGLFTLMTDTVAAKCVYEHGCWHVYDNQAQCVATAPVLILANGLDACRLMPSLSALLSGIGGQVSHIPAAWMPALPVVMAGDGYLTQSYQGMVSMGASYRQQITDDVTLKDHLDNMTKMKSFLPSVTLTSAQTASLSGRVGVRCVTPDRLPLIGAVPDEQADRHAAQKTGDIARVDGLYSLLGYASRGLIWSPLAAEILACELNGDPLPVGKKLRQAVDPARYVLKKIKKGAQPSFGSELLAARQ